MLKLELLPMTKKEFNTYFIQAIEAYACELSKSGRFPDPNEAYKFAQWEYNDIFFQGNDTSNTYVYHIDVNGTKVGVIWLLQEQEIGFIGDFLIYSPYQHRGYGTKTLCLIEQSAAQLGVKKIRLGVFIKNKIARKLYEKQGYHIIKERNADLLMEKTI